MIAIAASRTASDSTSIAKLRLQMVAQRDRRGEERLERRLFDRFARMGFYSRDPDNRRRNEPKSISSNGSASAFGFRLPRRQGRSIRVEQRGSISGADSE